MADAPPTGINGCRWCGTSERQHCSRYIETIGQHTYTEPTDAQRKERLLALSEARSQEGRDGSV